MNLAKKKSLQMVNVAVEDWVRWNLMTCRKEQPEEEQRQDEEKEERSKKRKKQVFWPSFHAQGSRVGSFPFDIIQSKEKNDFMTTPPEGS